VGELPEEEFKPKRGMELQSGMAGIFGAFKIVCGF
jgi:hypothetical protein